MHHMLVTLFTRSKASTLVRRSLNTATQPFSLPQHLKTVGEAGLDLSGPRGDGEKWGCRAKAAGMTGSQPGLLAKGFWERICHCGEWVFNSG